MCDFWSLTHSDESVSALTFQMTFHYFLSFSRAVTRSNSALLSHLFNSLMQEMLAAKPLVPTFILRLFFRLLIRHKGFNVKISCHHFVRGALCDIVGDTCKLIINVCTRLHLVVFVYPLHPVGSEMRDKNIARKNKIVPAERHPRHQQIGLHRHINYLERISHVMDLPPACVREITLEVIHRCND